MGSNHAPNASFPGAPAAVVAARRNCVCESKLEPAVQDPRGQAVLSAHRRAARHVVEETRPDTKARPDSGDHIVVDAGSQTKSDLDQWVAGALSGSGVRG
jgi:hypothetical protein